MGLLFEINIIHNGVWCWCVRTARVTNSECRYWDRDRVAVETSLPI